MDREDKERLIVRFETMYGPIQDLVARLSEAELSFVPKLPDAWPINDHLVHLLETDMLSWFRIRSAIAAPGTPSPAWDQEAWRSRLRYSALDGRECLGQAIRVRSLLAASCRAVLDEDWSAYHVLHSTRGRMDLAAILDLYCGHADFHLPYIERNLKAMKS